MRCNECGFMNEENATACVKCGTELAAAPPRVNPAPPSRQSSTPEGAPTMRGQVANTPSWDAPSQPQNPANPGHGTSPSDMTKCPSCGFYPLRKEPAPESPCPNCGAVGENDNTASDYPKSPPSKTMGMGDIQLGAAQTTIKLTNEKTGETIAFSDENNRLNREVLDAENPSISEKLHAVIKAEKGKATLEDKSSNGATFIQVKTPQLLENGTRIIIGNRIFTVEIE
ncbi:MAG: FHA domain-containing protein [Bacteroidota bacterium]